ncbi:MAG: hypothetical protein R3D62_01140 [Xanthobacteraceae bacterium]
MTPANAELRSPRLPRIEAVLLRDPGASIPSVRGMQMRKPIVACAAACVGVLAATTAFPTPRAVLAAECRAEPGQATPAGHHWYYRLDHGNERKCWYLKKVGTAAKKKPSRRAMPSADRPQQSASGPDDESTSSIGQQRRTKDREALFEEFLRWQQRQDSRR